MALSICLGASQHIMTQVSACTLISLSILPFFSLSPSLSLSLRVPFPLPLPLPLSPSPSLSLSPSLWQRLIIARRESTKSSSITRSASRSASRSTSPIFQLSQMSQLLTPRSQTRESTGGGGGGVGKAAGLADHTHMAIIDWIQLRDVAGCAQPSRLTAADSKHKLQVCGEGGAATSAGQVSRRECLCAREMERECV